MIVLEDEHGEVTHVVLTMSNRDTACGIHFRIVQSDYSRIELMTTTRRPPTCLWCVRSWLRRR